MSLSASGREFHVDGTVQDNKHKLVSLDLGVTQEHIVEGF